MIPLVVINSVNLSKAQASLEKQEADNTDYPGINYFQEGSVEVSFYFDQQFWLERLMMALMSSNIPFQVEYCEHVPNGFTGFKGKRIQF